MLKTGKKTDKLLRLPVIPSDSSGEDKSLQNALRSAVMFCGSIDTLKDFLNKKKITKDDFRKHKDIVWMLAAMNRWGVLQYFIQIDFVSKEQLAYFSGGANSVSLLAEHKQFNLIVLLAKKKLLTCEMLDEKITEGPCEDVCSTLIIACDLQWALLSLFNSQNLITAKQLDSIIPGGASRDLTILHLLAGYGQEDLFLSLINKGVVKSEHLKAKHFLKNGKSYDVVSELKQKNAKKILTALSDQKLIMPTEKELQELRDLQKKKKQNIDRLYRRLDEFCLHQGSWETKSLPDKKVLFKYTSPSDQILKVNIQGEEGTLEKEKFLELLYKNLKNIFSGSIMNRIGEVFLITLSSIELPQNYNNEKSSFRKEVSQHWVKIQEPIKNETAEPIEPPSQSVSESRDNQADLEIEEEIKRLNALAAQKKAEEKARRISERKKKKNSNREFNAEPVVDEETETKQLPQVERPSAKPGPILSDFARAIPRKIPSPGTKEKEGNGNEGSVSKVCSEPRIMEKQKGDSNGSNGRLEEQNVATNDSPQREEFVVKAKKQPSVDELKKEYRSILEKIAEIGERIFGNTIYPEPFFGLNRYINISNNIIPRVEEAKGLLKCLNAHGISCKSLKYFETMERIVEQRKSRGYLWYKDIVLIVSNAKSALRLEKNNCKPSKEMSVDASEFFPPNNPDFR